MKQFLPIGGIISELIWEYINKEHKLNIFYCELPKCISTENKIYLYETKNLTFVSH